MNRYLYDALPFLKDLDRDRQEQFETYFRSAPLWLMDTFQVEKLDKGKIFLREGDPADTIFFIGRGIIEAIDYRVYGIPYDYMRFDKVHAFGGMEFVMDLDAYRTTLRTVTDCILAKLPRGKFESWMHSDLQAFRHEAKLVAEYLVKEARQSRIFLFLEGADRLALLLANRFEQYGRGGRLMVQESRQSLASETGLCVKSVNRAVKKFMDEGLITREGARILLDRRQYEGLRALVSRKIDLDSDKCL